MEYNVPNTSNTTTGFMTSQDVGLNQLPHRRTAAGQRWTNPMNIATPSGGARSAPSAPVRNSPRSLLLLNSESRIRLLDVGNFKAYQHGGAIRRYLTVDGIDPLLNSSTPYSTYNGTLPLAGSAEIANVIFRPPPMEAIPSGRCFVWSTPEQLYSQQNQPCHRVAELCPHRNLNQPPRLRQGV